MHSTSSDITIDVSCEETNESVVPPITRSMTLPLALLCTCVALLMTGFGIIVPVFPQRLQALGLGAETLALMEGGFGLGMFLFSTPLGTLADRIGRKPLVLLSLTGFIATNLFLAFVNIPILFILARFVEGALAAGLFPAATAMIGDSMPAEKQGRWMGIITTAQALGIAVGPGIGGFLYKAWGFTSPFLLSASIALLASLVALIVLPETLPDQVRAKVRMAKEQKSSHEKSTADPSLRLTHLLLLCAPLILIDFGTTFIYPFVLPQYPFFFERVLHYDTAQYGLIISVYGIALAAFPILLGRLSEILPKKLLIVVGILLYTTLNGSLLFLHQYPLLILAATITGMGSALLLPAMGIVYLSVTNDENRSRILGLRGSAISLGILLGPLTQAALGHFITPQTTFAIGTVVPLIVALLAFLLLKNPEKNVSLPKR